MEANTSNVKESKKSVKVSVILNELETLKEITQLMTREARSRFAGRYGRILDLLSIPVDTLALNALTQYWNHSLRCFELPNLDTTPTIEEYAYMLRLPVSRGTQVYHYLGHYVTEAKIAQLIGAHPNPSNVVGKGMTRGWKKKFLEDYLKRLAQQQNWPLFNKVLALTIYGMVLFPFMPAVVDQSAMDVFYKFEVYGVNPIPAILADTFLSLTICHQGKQGKLKCCVHLLSVWIMTHMYAGGHVSDSDDPLRSFHRIPMRQKGLYEWRKEFENVQIRLYKWVCPWYKEDEVILHCGKFSNVPLMGPRGCITYTPALVMMQFKRIQDQPKEEQIGGLYFLYQEEEDIKRQSVEVRTAWGDVHVFGSKELGRKIVFYTEKYTEWRKARRRNNSMLQIALKEEIEAQKEGQMRVQVENLQAQIEALDAKKQEADLKVVILESRVQKLNREIEHLKDECADATGGFNRLKRARNIRELDSNAILAKSHRLQDEIDARDKTIARITMGKDVIETNVRIQDQAMRKMKERIDILQGMLVQAEHHSDQGWKLAKIYQADMEEAHKKEEQWRVKFQELEFEKRRIEIQMLEKEQQEQHHESMASFS